VLAGALALSACGGATRTSAGGAGGSGCPSGTATVTAHGHGTTQGPPDLLTVSLGVQTSASSAREALTANSSAANGLIAQLHKDGVADADLQTSGLSIQPTYNKTVITGYQVTNTVTAQLHNIAGAGALIDDASQAAGNAIQVNSIAFSIQDDSALTASAKQAAVRQARSQAQAMATGAGMDLGRLCSLSDNSAQVPQPIFGQLAAGGGGTAGVAAPPIETGAQKVTADVTAVYRLGR
jgi:uncharacterized protein YggE